MDDAWRESQDDFVLEQEEEIDISDPGKNISEDLVVTKYKMAGEIVNKVLKQTVEKCVEGASVRDICVSADRLMTEYTGQVFKKFKDMKKGIAFPACVSVDNCVSNFSPTSSEPDRVLTRGDVAKVQVAGHVDGFVAAACHTLVVGEPKVEGRKADVVLAAHFALQAGIRTLVPGNMTRQVAEVVRRVANVYNCTPIDGKESYQLKQNYTSNGKRIVQCAEEDVRNLNPDFDIETHEVYALDVTVSTGDGSVREGDARATIYKRCDETYYQLKLKASRNVLSEIDTSYGTMAFNVRNLKDQKKARLGLVECLKHKILRPYAVTFEKPGELVARFMATVLVMPGGQHIITGLPFREELYESMLSYKDDAYLKEFIERSINLKTLKKRRQRMIARGIAGTSYCSSSSSGS